MADAQSRVGHVRARLRRLAKHNEDARQRAKTLAAESHALADERAALAAAAAADKDVTADLMLRVAHAKLHLDALQSAKGRLQREIAEAKLKRHGDAFEVKLRHVVRSKLEAAAVQKQNARKADEVAARRAADEAEATRRAIEAKQQVLAAAAETALAHKDALARMEARLRVMRQVVDDTLHPAAPSRPRSASADGGGGGRSA